jgi:hypothetical protein
MNEREQLDDDCVAPGREAGCQGRNGLADLQAVIWHNATVAGLCAAGYRPDTNRYPSGNAKSAQTDRATWPLTTYPRAKRSGICEES